MPAVPHGWVHSTLHWCVKQAAESSREQLRDLLRSYSRLHAHGFAASGSKLACVKLAWISIYQIFLCFNLQNYLMWTDVDSASLVSSNCFSFHEYCEGITFLALIYWAKWDKMQLSSYRIIKFVFSLREKVFPILWKHTQFFCIVNTLAFLDVNT